MKIFNKENFNKANFKRVGKVILISVAAGAASVLIYSKLKTKEDVIVGDQMEDVQVIEEPIEENSTTEEA